jgi:FKBP-type peptidyl-prolyl cis-trans isomerase FklB
MRKTFDMAKFAAASALIVALTTVGNAAAQQTLVSNSGQTPTARQQAPTQSSSTTASKSQNGTATDATHHATVKPASELTLTTDKDKDSYAIGMNIGKSLHRDAVDVDPAILLRGLKDAMAGGKTLLTEEEAKAAMATLQAQVRKTQEEKARVAADTNKKEGDAFLAENKTKGGVVTLPSGLQYKIVTEGTGPKPTAGDSVVCNYRGTLLNGTEFDSSYKHGEPITIPVGSVIKGWSEALQLMPVGSKWQLFIPPDLAYGPRGAGNDIGPNSTIVFEVELISIKPQITSGGTAPAPNAPQN